MKTLLFDYGGTLDTAAKHWYYVFEEAYKAVGLQIPDNELRQAYVFGERYLAKNPVITPNDDFATLLKKKICQQFNWLEEAQLLSGDKAHHEALIDAITAHCDNFARLHTQQSAQVLQALKDKGYKLIIVSNFYGNLKSVLAAYNLLPFFSDIVESAVVGVRKPEPAIWQLGVKTANASAANSIAIGDSYSKDIVPAHASGIETIWFKGKEWEDKDYDESLPTHIITSLTDILQIL